LGGGDAFEAVVAALSDKDFVVRAAAAEALGQMVDERAAEPLRLVRRTDNAAEARRAVATVLAKLVPAEESSSQQTRDTP